MKLMLHWLVWDLRRFRFMLAGWSLLVLGYAGFLGWVQGNILTIDPDWMEWSEPFAKCLGAAALMMVFYVFSTDPAGGREPFWKTRPPAGPAVAGSKLVVVLGFFVLLPMAAWLVMNALCTAPEAVTQGSPAGMSWTKYLWSVLILPVSLLALGAAVARGPGQILLTLGMAFLLALAPSLVHMVFNPRLLDGLDMVVEQVADPMIGSPVAWLWLAWGCGSYLLMRWRRTPARVLHWMLVGFPLLMVCLAPRASGRKQQEGLAMGSPVSDPAVAERIKVKGIGLRVRGPVFSLPVNFAQDESWRKSVYEMNLVLENPGPELLVGARWRNFRLTSPDGRVLEADPEVVERLRLPGEGYSSANRLTVKGLTFDREAVKPFSLLPCRAEGTLRVKLNRTESTVMPLKPGTRQQGPAGWLYLPPDRFAQDHWLNGITMAPLTGGGGVREIRMERIGSGQSFSTEFARMLGRSGFLIQSRQQLVYVNLQSQRRDLPSLRLARQLYDGVPVRDWQLGVTWEVPSGYVDLPVVLEPFVLPRQVGDTRLVRDLIAGTVLAAEAPADRVRVAVSYVLILANQAYRPGESPEMVEAALEQWLEQLTAGHLPVLLDLTRENLPWNEQELVSDKPWTRRVAALMTEAQAATLRDADPALFRYLEPALLAAGRIQTREPVKVDAAALTDQQLEEEWDRGSRSETLPVEVIGEGLRRGLPWSIGVVEELTALRPNERDVTALLAILPEFSDCPPDREKARRWVVRYAQRLEWDAAAKRWRVDPEPER